MLNVWNLTILLCFIPATALDAISPLVTLEPTLVGNLDLNITLLLLGGEEEG